VGSNHLGLSIARTRYITGESLKVDGRSTAQLSKNRPTRGAEGSKALMAIPHPKRTISLGTPKWWLRLSLRKARDENMLSGMPPMPLSHSQSIEHFQAKWIPVPVKKMRYN
jgi:hypothetical protein